VSRLVIESLGFSYPGRADVLTGITLGADGPSVVAVMGPNGAGKSTLLDLLSGQKRPGAGRCRIQGRDVSELSREEVCRLVAHVPQTIPGDVPYTVEEVILTGRIPYGRGLYESDDDFRAMENAIERTRLGEFRRRPFRALSGGEKQRVLVAAALCQEAPILLLDEPSAHLDPENEAQLWELFRTLKECGHLIVVVTHHLALAAQNADRIWLLERGRLAADGPPSEAMQPKDLERVFRVPFHWHKSAEGRVFLTYGH